MARPQAIVPLKSTTSYLRWMLYGDPGVGKTALTGTIRESHLILRSQSDNVEAAKIVSHSQADVWTLGNWQDAEDAWDYLRLEGCRVYKFLSFDTVNLFQDLGLDDIMQDLVVTRPHRKVYLPDKGEYGQNMNRLMQLSRNLVTLPMHVIFVAHAFHDTDQDGNERVMPAIQGKNMPDKLCGLCNLVTYMRVARQENRERRVLYTNKRDLFYAKDGFHVFGGRVENPTVPAMMAKIGAKLSPTPPGKVPATKVVAAKKVTMPTGKVAGQLSKAAQKVAPSKKAAAPVKKAPAAAKVANATKATKKGN